MSVVSAHQDSGHSANEKAHFRVVVLRNEEVRIAESICIDPLLMIVHGVLLP